MLPRKDNVSTPMSRIGSSTRLNQGLSPSQPNSFPSTPTSYQISSLNPIRSGSRMANNKPEDLEFEEQFKNLEIVKEILHFETQLAELSQKVGSIDGNGLDITVNSLLMSNQRITKHIDELEKHRKLGEHIESLERSRDDLDQKSKDALKQLINYRSELKQLPSLPTKRDPIDQKGSELDVDEVLKYGMKLSKFTKAPPSTNVAFQIHPNNFIWPAEDSLRRGMLAMSSLKEDEIIKKELGLDEPQTTHSTTTTTSSAIKSEGDKQEEEKRPNASGSNGDVEMKQPERRSSRVTRRKPEKTEEVAPKLDLDLFDPENEDDSD